MDYHALLSELMKELNATEYVKPSDIPNIDLYMDQVTTFMESKLRESSRNPEEDKILTKTMINNYAKNKLIPAPEKKKYSKEHLLLLILIYYFKSILSIKDIQTILNPLTEKYYGHEMDEDGELGLKDIYTEIVEVCTKGIDDNKKDLIRKMKLAESTFQDADAEDKEVLQLFSFICAICFDIHIKKSLVEKIVDEMAEAMGKNPES
ncbi:MAG: DUF1836 domain-containing protein [Lachnospiraceae bacterium]|jgi:hypothetical protein|nr:DUF1836 domain-containing protein [Lachnospiraceae bacterium]